MRLTLTNHYPMPYPKNPTQNQVDDMAERATDRELVLDGVVSVQQLHTVTVEFKDDDAYEAAKQKTGWQFWSYLVLEAPQAEGEGYGPFPAIVALNEAWCGYILSDEEN